MHQAPTDGIAEVSIHEENLAEPFIETQPPHTEKAHNLVVVPPAAKRGQVGDYLFADKNDRR